MYSKEKVELFLLAVDEGMGGVADAADFAGLDGGQRRFHCPGPAGAGLTNDAGGKAPSSTDRERLIERTAQAAAGATLAKLAKR